VPLLVSLTRKRVIYLALELDRSWTEIAPLVFALLLPILILSRPKETSGHERRNHNP